MMGGPTISAILSTGEVELMAHLFGRDSHEILRRVPPAGDEAASLARHCEAMLARHDACCREHLEDVPDVRDWVWTADRGGSALRVESAARPEIRRA